MPCRAGFVALLGEHSQRGVDAGAPARPLPRLLARPFAELASSLGGDPGQGFTDRGAGVGCVVDGGGEEPGGEVVLAGREAHRQLALGAPVQLRGPSGARSLTAAEPAELGGEQPVGDEPVEVERGN